MVTTKPSSHASSSPPQPVDGVFTSWGRTDVVHRRGRVYHDCHIVVGRAGGRCAGAGDGMSIDLPAVLSLLSTLGPADVADAGAGANAAGAHVDALTAGPPDDATTTLREEVQLVGHRVLEHHACIL